MTYLRPQTVEELIQQRAEHPEWTVLSGGTDLMIDINFARLRPAGVIDVSQVQELKRIDVADDGIRIGGAVTFERLETEGAEFAPALATAARGVGSPQIRSTATLGGNLGTASPAGDAHPSLIALGAVIELASVRGTRNVAIDDFFLAPGRSVMEPDEVITRVWLPPRSPRQHFTKVGTRNAMVISVAALSLAVDLQARTVGVGLGSVGPVPLRATQGERLLEAALWPEADNGLTMPSPETSRGFAEAVQATAIPIDDLRATAAYRKHMVGVMARRCLEWCLRGAR